MPLMEHLRELRRRVFVSVIALVPGVVLLEQVALALRDWRGQRLSRVLEAKFVAPLLPEQEARIALTEARGRVRFEIHRGEDLLARGSIEGTI